MTKQTTAETNYVYLFKKDDTYKIGFSKNPDARLLAVAPAGSAQVIHTFPSARPREVEKTLHRRFGDKHIEGEWFRLAQEDVDAICRLGRTDAAEELPPDLFVQLPDVPQGIDRYTGTRIVFHCDDELLATMEEYEASLAHQTGRSQIIRDLLREMLKAKEFPKKKKAD